MVDRVKGAAGALALGFVFLQGAPVHGQVSALGGFVENRGQWSAPVAYLARVGDHFVGVDEEGLWLHRQVAHANGTRRDVVHVGFEGLGADVVVRGERPLPGVHHYFLGNDPSRWVTNVERHERVVLESQQASLVVAPRTDGTGVDLVLHGRTTTPVVMLLEGVGDIREEDNGSLTARDTRSQLRLVADVALRPAGSGRFLVPLPPSGEEGVHVGLEWSTLLGGTLADAVVDLARGPEGDLFLAGITQSADFPATPGAIDGVLGAGNTTVQDAYVARLASDGSDLLAATFLGGTNADTPTSLALAADGSPLLAGSSRNFPTTAGAWDTTLGEFEGFVAKLSPMLDSLMFSTAVGGGGDDYVADLSVLPDGRILILGRTESPEFFTLPGAFDSTFDTLAGEDEYLIRLLPDGSGVDYATFFSDLNGAQDVGTLIADRIFVDADGRLLLVGRTSSEEFLATTTIGAAPSGNVDIFVTRFDATWTTPEASLLFGATAGIGIRDAARSDDGDIAIVGWTSATDVPTTPGAFQPFKSGLEDGVVVGVDASLTELEFSTYLGGFSTDMPRAVAIDESGVVTVSGITWSSNFPVTKGAFQEQAGVINAFVSRFDPTGRRLLHSTRIGAEGGEAPGNPVVLLADEAGSIIVAGTTVTPDTFPTTPDAYMPEADRGILTFISKLTLLPEGTARHGEPSPAGSAPAVIGTASGPFVGQGDFALTCTGAPKGPSQGWLVLSPNLLEQPLPVVGVQAWIDLGSAVLLSVRSGPTGFALARLPVPGDAALAGVSMGAQFFWSDPVSARWTASGALAITVQP